jgi:hypothetical protein
MVWLSEQTNQSCCWKYVYISREWINGHISFVVFISNLLCLDKLNIFPTYTAVHIWVVKAMVNKLISSIFPHVKNWGDGWKFKTLTNIYAACVLQFHIQTSNIFWKVWTLSTSLFQKTKILVVNAEKRGVPYWPLQQNQQWSIMYPLSELALWKSCALEEAEYFA